MKTETTYEQMQREDVKRRPYMVYHPEGEGNVPTFETWAEAVAAQKKWNQTCPGHRAYRRNLPPIRSLL